jgi:hypothetical protein
MFGLAGAVVAFNPELEPFIAPLWLASEVMSLIPSASPDLTSKFESSYADLKTQLADGVSQAQKSLNEQSQLVRQDLALLTAVGQLRLRGTWELDRIGMGSIGQQGFAMWVYKTLLPTFLARYIVSNCTTDNICTGPPSGAWVQGSAPNFTGIGPSPTSSSPCDTTPGGPFAPSQTSCSFVAPPSDVATTLWGALPANCAYDGANASTAWTFPDPDPKKGGCSLGVDPSTTLADPTTVSATRRWNFSTFTGNPDVNAGVAAGLAGSANRIGGNAAVVRLRGTAAVPRRVRLGRARVVFDRFLFERGGARELVRHRSGRKLPPLALSRRGGAYRTAAGGRRRAGPRVRLRLRRAGGRLLSFRLVARNVRLPRPPDACNGTRPGVDVATLPVPLHTRLRIDDGRRRPARISLPLRWRCRRDRLGNVRRLVLDRPRSRRPRGRRPAVALRGPRRLTRGRHAVYRIRVRNRRRTTAYDVLIRAVPPRGFRPRRVRRARVGAGGVVWRLRALRSRRSRTLRLRVRVPRSAHRRACQTVIVSAIDTRPARKRVCARIRP